MDNMDSIGHGYTPIDISHSFEKMMVDLEKQPSEEKLSHMAKFLEENASHIEPGMLHRLDNVVKNIGKKGSSESLNSLSHKIVSMMKDRQILIEKKMLPHTIRSLISSEIEEVGQPSAIKELEEYMPLSRAERAGKFQEMKQEIAAWKKEKDPFNKWETGRVLFSKYTFEASRDPYMRLALQEFHYLGIGTEKESTETLLLKISQMKSPDQPIEFIHMADGMMNRFMRKDNIPRPASTFEFGPRESSRG